MFDTPVDTWYLWLGVATTSLVAFGVATSLPTTPPPDAERAAATIDSVATSQYDAMGQQPLDATAVRLGPHRLGLRNDGGTTHAAFAYGPVTPVQPGSTLERVLEGAPPERVYTNASRFRAAAAAARNGSREWDRTGGRLLVRHVTWGEVDVTLVGA